MSQETIMTFGEFREKYYLKFRNLNEMCEYEDKEKVFRFVSRILSNTYLYCEENNVEKLEELRKIVLSKKFVEILDERWFGPYPKYKKSDKTTFVVYEFLENKNEKEMVNLYKVYLSTMSAKEIKDFVEELLEFYKNC